MSRIITFYSYKGGVGRTLALANIGVLLASRGHRVLLVDMDLEAPGLELYFQDHWREPLPSARGVLPLLVASAADSTEDWRKHVQRVDIACANGGLQQACQLFLMPSGIESTEYSLLLEQFSWVEFLGQHDGGPILERWRAEWLSEFDFVLIDSRTGLTDTGGICTVLLPDILVLVFAANEQSFRHALGVTEQAQQRRRSELAVERTPLTVLPLPGRFDGREETELAGRWLERFAADLAVYYDDWLPTRFTPRQMLEVTKVPYVARFSFGECLPVVSHSLTDPEWPGFYFNHAARLLESDFQAAGAIIDPSFTYEAVVHQQATGLAVEHSTGTVSRVSSDVSVLFERLIRTVPTHLRERLEGFSRQLVPFDHGGFCGLVAAFCEIAGDLRSSEMRKHFVATASALISRVAVDVIEGVIDSETLYDRLRGGGELINVPVSTPLFVEVLMARAQNREVLRLMPTPTGAIGVDVLQLSQFELGPSIGDHVEKFERVLWRRMFPTSHAYVGARDREVLYGKLQAASRIHKRSYVLANKDDGEVWSNLASDLRMITFVCLSRTQSDLLGLHEFELAHLVSDFLRLSEKDDSR